MEKVLHCSNLTLSINPACVDIDFSFLNLKWHLHIPCYFSFFVSQGFVPAINALAWYYEQFERDYKKAVELWEQADVLESPDAALNLAVMYSQGLYPGKAADQVSSALKHLLLYLQTFTECLSQDANCLLHSLWPINTI